MRADEFGEEVSARLSASSSGVRELWRLFKVLNKTKKTKAKQKVKESMPQPKQGETEENDEETPVEGQEAVTVLDDTTDTKEERDLKRMVLHIMSEIADLHERIKK